MAGKAIPKTTKGKVVRVANQVSGLHVKLRW